MACQGQPSVNAPQTHRATLHGTRYVRHDPRAYIIVKHRAKSRGKIVASQHWTTLNLDSDVLSRVLCSERATLAHLSLNPPPPKKSQEQRKDRRTQSGGTKGARPIPLVPFRGRTGRTRRTSQEDGVMRITLCTERQCRPWAGRRGRSAVAGPHLTFGGPCGPPRGLNIRGGRLG